MDELGVKYENRLHLLDYSEQAGTVEYTLTYTARDKNPLAVTSITGADAVVKSAVGSLTVTFNKAVNAASFTWADLDLFRQGDLANDLITDAVTVTQINSTTFEIGNLGELTAADGYYQLIVRTDGITDTVGNAGSEGKALNWTMAAAVPAVVSIGGIDDLMNSKADSVEVTFTASVNAGTLTPAVFRVNGAPSNALVITPVGESNTKFTVSGISGLLTEGGNVLEIDLTQIAGINGNAGLQASRKEWTIDLTAPAVQEISESLGVSETAPTELVFEATEDVTVSADALTLKKDGVAIASDSMSIAIDGKKIIVTGINSLSDGTYELELALDKIADAAGNTGSGIAVKTWAIDKTAPAQLAGFSLAAFCDLGESDSDARTSTRDLTLVGTLPEAGLRVRIYQQTGTRGRTLLRELTPDGTSLETAVKVQGGHSTLIAELTDAAGNTSETSLSVFVDELAVSAEFQEKFEEVLTESPQSITFVLSEEVVGLTAANFTLSIDGENVPLDGMSIVQTDALTYVLSGITASANGAYTLSLDMAGLVKKSTGLACSGIQSTGWSIYRAEPPTIVSTSINSEQMLDGLATFSIVFSTAMNCDELIESGAIIQAVRIVEVDSDNNVVRFITLSGDDFQYIEDSNTLVWNSAAPLSEGGNYRLVLDTGMLKSEEGVSLAGSNAESGHSYQVSEPSEVSSPTQNGGYSVPVWYDYNGDGKLDLLVGEKATDTTGRIRVLLNTGTTENPVFSGYTYLPGADGDWTIAASNCLGVAPRFADVNGDGIDDLVYGTSDGRIEYALRSNGVFETGVSLLADGTAIDIGNRAVFDLVDWNGDGHLDIVSGAMDGKIYLFVNKGDWTFSAAQTLSIQLENGWSAPAVADLDGDGDLDVVSGDAKGNLYRFLNNGDGTFAVVDIATGESDRSRPFICDVNGDGILDITVGYKSGKVSVLYGEKGSVVAEDFHINSSPVFSGTPSAKVEDYQVTLSWEPASDDFGVAGYKVRIGNTEYQTTGTTLTLADVDVGMYSYQVGAVDEAGLEGWSSLSTFEVKDVTPPVLNGLPSAKVWKNSVRFSWESASDNVEVAGYRIELNDQTYDTSLTVQFVSGLELGDYEYRIGAIDTSGLITWSEKQSFTVTELADTLDHVLTETVPTANYGPGCVASSIGMLLGYYDKFGYCGFDVSDLISGEIELDSRNSADALLNTFIATPGYTSRFVGQSESAERPYTLTEQNELNTAAWDSLADWLGTGQKWRGNEDYATAYYYGSLDDVKESQDTYSVSGTALPVKFADFKYGLNLFVESVNYKLDSELTRTVKADTAANGTFSFADYTAEIDAGRGVLISLASPGNLGHMVLGYGYNEATGEIIFDDTTESGRRMVWNGTYQYAGHEYHIQSITTVVLDTDGLNIFDKTPPVITLTGDNKTPLRQTVLTATVDDGSIILYSTDNENWTEYSKAIDVTANATYYFKATDAAGNEGTNFLTFANIDTTAPVITLTGDNQTPLQKATLTASTDDESPISYRIGEDGEWMTYTEAITVNANATYFFKATDEAGNKDEKQITFANIDTEKPTVSITPNTIDPAQSVTVTAEFSDNVELKSKQYKIGNGDWIDYENGVTVTENATVYFKAVDTAGNESAEASIEIKNIDTMKPVITLSADTETPLQKTTLTAMVDDGSDIYYSTDNANWTKYTEALTVTANATYFFRATDEAGNEDTKQITFANIDTIAPVITLSGDNTTPLRESALTATVDDGSPIYFRIGDSGEWMEYKEPITVTDNVTYNFLSRDAAGNEGTNFLTFANIDTVAPVITLSGDNQTLVQQATLTATVDDGSLVYYRVGDSGDWTEYKEAITVTANATYYFKATDAAGNEGTNFLSFENIIQAPGSDVAPQTQTWEKTEDAAQYIVEYSTDNFEHVIQLVVDSNSLDSFQMPAGKYKMRVKTDDSDEWTIAAPIVAEEASDEPKLIKSNADGHADVFFVNTVGTWESGYVAQHVGSTDDDTWEGTKEYAALFGKNKLTDIIEGATTDANVLLMSDDAIGDALFVDDIYSASPDELGLSQSRIAQIDEIRAGAGNDVVDMTSQRFEYIGDGLTIRGGDGNDTIWANKGDNFLFGDAGNDRIIGASGNDVIVGGIGNDRMHGGGGNDIFTFCDNWGIDEVEQLGTGKVTLWFVSGDESKWNAETLTYIDGENSVKVKGVASVTLKFGDDGSEQYANLASAGIFTEFTSQRIFEESGKGLLA